MACHLNCPNNPVGSSGSHWRARFQRNGNAQPTNVLACKVDHWNKWHMGKQPLLLSQGVMVFVVSNNPLMKHTIIQAPCDVFIIGRL